MRPACPVCASTSGCWRAESATGASAPWKPMPEEMLLAGAKAALDKYAEAIKVAQARESREAQRNTPAAKLQVLQERLKKLDTKMKRLATSRKKLERKIGYYQRQ